MRGTRCCRPSGRGVSAASCSSPGELYGGGSSRVGCGPSCSPQSLPTGPSVQWGFFPSSQCCLVALRAGPRIAPPAERHVHRPDFLPLDVVRVSQPRVLPGRALRRSIGLFRHCHEATTAVWGQRVLSLTLPLVQINLVKQGRGGATSRHRMTPQLRCKSAR